MNSLDDVAKKMIQVIQEDLKKGTRGYDAVGIVRRVDNNVVWVHFDNGIDETPVVKSIDCRVGDKVRVRVDNGKAFLVGNETAPPTDDAKAITAETKAVIAQETAHSSMGLAEQAEAEAGKAKEAADNALTSANGKNKVYHQASQPSGGTYVNGDTWFDTDDGYKMYTYNGSSWVAEEFGNAAIADLSINNAKIANGTIQSAKISGLDVGKLTGGYIDASHINASAITIGQSQVTNLTTDLAAKADSEDIPTAVSQLTNDSSYATTTQVGTAKSEAISTAAADATSKANAAAQTATNYLTQISGTSGISVHDVGDTSNFANINSSGMTVYKGGSEVASFGSEATFGSGTSWQTTVGDGYITMKNAYYQFDIENISQGIRFITYDSNSVPVEFFMDVSNKRFGFSHGINVAGKATLGALDAGVFAVTSHATASAATSADTNRSGTISLSKSGYTPLAIVGWNIASSSGANAGYANLMRCYLSARSSGEGTVTYVYRNTASSSMTATLTVYILWLKTTA